MLLDSSSCEDAWREEGENACARARPDAPQTGCISGADRLITLRCCSAHSTQSRPSHPHLSPPSTFPTRPQQQRQLRSTLLQSRCRGLPVVQYIALNLPHHPHLVTARVLHQPAPTLSTMAATAVTPPNPTPPTPISSRSHLQSVPDSVRFSDVEEKMLAHWEAISAFETSMANAEGKPRFTFYDGPPFATGLPHYGHILAGTIKDVVTRYAAQTGFYVSRRFGKSHSAPPSLPAAAVSRAAAVSPASTVSSACAACRLGKSNTHPLRVGSLALVGAARGAHLRFSCVCACAVYVCCVCVYVGLLPGRRHACADQSRLHVPGRAGGR